MYYSNTRNDSGGGGGDGDGGGGGGGDGLLKSKSFATTSFNHIYHLSSRSPNLDEMYLNDVKLSFSNNNNSNNSGQDTIIRPGSTMSMYHTNFGFPYTTSKTIVETSASSALKFGYGPYGQKVGGAKTIVEQQSNHNLAMRQPSSMSTQNHQYQVLPPRPNTAMSGENLSFFNQPQHSYYYQKQPQETSTKTMLDMYKPMSLDEATKTFSLTASRPSLSMKSYTLDNNINDDNNNNSRSSSSSNKPVNNNNNKKIKAIAKDLLFFIKEEKTQGDCSEDSVSLRTTSTIYEASSSSNKNKLAELQIQQQQKSSTSSSKAYESNSVIDLIKNQKPQHHHHNNNNNHQPPPPPPLAQISQLSKSHQSNSQPAAAETTLKSKFGFKLIETHSKPTLTMNEQSASFASDASATKTPQLPQYATRIFNSNYQQNEEKQEPKSTPTKNTNEPQNILRKAYLNSFDSSFNTNTNTNNNANTATTSGIKTEGPALKLEKDSFSNNNNSHNTVSKHTSQRTDATYFTGSLINKSNPSSSKSTKSNDPTCSTSSFANSSNNINHSYEALTLPTTTTTNIALNSLVATLDPSLLNVNSSSLNVIKTEAADLLAVPPQREDSNVELASKLIGNFQSKFAYKPTQQLPPPPPPPPSSSSQAAATEASSILKNSNQTSNLKATAITEKSLNIPKKSAELASTFTTATSSRAASQSNLQQILVPKAASNIKLLVNHNVQSRPTKTTVESRKSFLLQAPPPPTSNNNKLGGGENNKTENFLTSTQPSSKTTSVMQLRHTLSRPSLPMVNVNNNNNNSKTQPDSKLSSLRSSSNIVSTKRASLSYMPSRTTTIIEKPLTCALSKSKSNAVNPPPPPSVASSTSRNSIAGKSKLLPSSLQTKSILETTKSYGFISKPIEEKKPTEGLAVERTRKNSFLPIPASYKAAGAAATKQGIEYKVSSFMPTKSIIEPAKLSSTTTSKDLNMYKMSKPAGALQTSASKNNITSLKTTHVMQPATAPHRDLRNAYLPTKSIIEKPLASYPTKSIVEKPLASYSTKSIIEKPLATYPTKSIVEKPLTSYSTSKIVSHSNTNTNTNSKSNAAPPTKSIIERRTSFGFTKPSEAKNSIKSASNSNTHPGWKASDSIIDQLVISLEKHEKEIQKQRSKFIASQMTSKNSNSNSNNNIMEMMTASSSNSSTNNNSHHISSISYFDDDMSDCHHGFDTAPNDAPHNAHNIDDDSSSSSTKAAGNTNAYQSQMSSFLVPDIIKQSEPPQQPAKKAEYFQNFKPKALAFRNANQSQNNNIKPLSNLSTPKGMINNNNNNNNNGRKPLVQNKKVIPNKAQPLKSGGGGGKINSSGNKSGYLSCRSRTFSNLDAVIEVEREEYSHCSDDSKSTTMKTWSIATNDQETFSSVEEIFGLKAENQKTKEEAQMCEESNEFVHEIKPVEAFETFETNLESRENLTNEKESINSPPETAVSTNTTASAPGFVVPYSSNLNEPTTESEISECRKFLIKIGVINEDPNENSNRVYNSKSDVIEQVFKSIDQDEIGKIRVEEVLSILNKINSNFERKYAYSKEQMESFVKQLDMDCDGWLSLEEFILSFEKF